MNLENKKKKELIEIILRKDAVEEQLRQEIKKERDDKDELDNSFSQLKKAYDNFNNGYRDLNALCYRQEHHIAKLKKRNWFWFGTTIAVTIAALLVAVL